MVSLGFTLDGLSNLASTFTHEQDGSVWTTASMLQLRTRAAKGSKTDNFSLVFPFIYRQGQFRCIIKEYTLT
jgi:hypothetical protein